MFVYLFFFIVMFQPFYCNFFCHFSFLPWLAKLFCLQGLLIIIIIIIIINYDMYPKSF